MNLRRSISYCTNIYPAETWQQTLHNLNKHVLYVKRHFSPQHPFPLGLRLSAQAAAQVSPKDIHQFALWCEHNQCFPQSMNGFPYGNFHGKAVKAGVYLPDWRSLERVNYTCQLANILCQVSKRLPEQQQAMLSISTVPVAYKDHFDYADWPVVRRNILSCLCCLEKLHNQYGIKIQLALEPEPCCVLEQTREVLEFYRRMDFPDQLLPYLGICLDCCHQAVEFEQPQQIIADLRGAGISIAKVQVSSALRARTASEIDYLFNFSEDIYLHQSVLKLANGERRWFTDIPYLQEYIRTNQPLAEDIECRVHFHVPIFLSHLGEVGTTQSFIEALQPLLASNIPLEVETYSFSVLPKAWQLSSVDDCVLRELNWLRDVVNAPDSRS